jgi:hypothetical protein
LFYSHLQATAQSVAVVVAPAIEVKIVAMPMIVPVRVH